MPDSFYKNILNPDEKIILFTGGGGKSSLINRISQDCQSLEKTVIVTSVFPFNNSINAEIVICRQFEYLKEQITHELKSKNVIFLGKEYRSNNILGYKLKELNQIANMLEVDHIFIEADSTSGKSLSSYEKLKTAYLFDINRVVNVIGADILNRTKNEIWIDSHDSFWDSNPVMTPPIVAQWIKMNPNLNKLLKKVRHNTFFINKVDNIVLENLAIPLAKQFKINGIERVIYGSVFKSILHRVEV